MGIEVLLRGKAIYRSSFPVCPINDRSKEVVKTLVFSFKGGHNFQGTTPNQAIDGNIWQAGTDPGVILLGLSFATRKELLLNIIHIAKPDRESISEIDTGLTVRTFPINSSMAP